MINVYFWNKRKGEWLMVEKALKAERINYRWLLHMPDGSCKEFSTRTHDLLAVSPY